MRMGQGKFAPGLSKSGLIGQAVIEQDGKLLRLERVQRCI